MSILSSQLDRINPNARMPKYRQVIQTVLSDIRHGVFKPGQRIPSINETSEEYYLSRDTVEKAYKELRRRGVISAIPGKGYYVNGSENVCRLKVMVCVGELGDAEKELYNAFTETLGEKAVSALFVYDSSAARFESMILDHLSSNDYFVVLPQFGPEIHKAREVIRRIPRNQLLVVDRCISQAGDRFRVVHQDHSEGLTKALLEEKEALTPYQKLVLVLPKTASSFPELQLSFDRSCQQLGINGMVTRGVEGDLCPGYAYLFADEQGLYLALQKARLQHFSLGKEVGLMTLYDHPAHEVLAGGISAVTPNYRLMGKTAAHILLGEETANRVEIPHQVYLRASL